MVVWQAVAEVVVVPAQPDLDATVGKVAVVEGSFFVRWLWHYFGANQDVGKGGVVVVGEAGVGSKKKEGFRVLFFSNQEILPPCFR